MCETERVLCQIKINKNGNEQQQLSHGVNNINLTVF